MKKSFIYPVAFMALVTAFFTFILAFMDYSTADKITFMQETDLRKKILYIFDIDIKSSEPDEVDRVFKTNVEEDFIDGKRIFYLMDDNSISAYAFPAAGSGLWGNVEAYVGITSDYSTIVGIDFISHSETPGLGGRISEEGFKNQFRGLDISKVIDGNYILYKPAPSGNVDAIAGATLTSKSVSNFLNEDIDDFIKSRKGE